MVVLSKKEEEEGKDSLHKLGLRMEDEDKGVKERRKREWEKRVGMPQVKILSGILSKDSSLWVKRRWFSGKRRWGMSLEALADRRGK